MGNVRTVKQPATIREIREILGPLDEEAVIEIEYTGAAAADVREAKTWLDDDDYMETETGKVINLCARRVYAILQREQDRPDAAER